MLGVRISLPAILTFQRFMPEKSIHRAANVEEAVELANRFREEGRYNWFRGQAKAWPPYSSLFRTSRANDPELTPLALRRLSMFFKWLREIPQLKPLLDNPHDAFIIAQHYGIPTHYIDFTIEPGVAGFFAADTDIAQGPDELACIYCVDTEELTDVWDMMKGVRAGTQMELVQADVSNLWRLEAQHGCFLFCNYNWDVDFPMDRILFPQSGYPSWPTKEIIYPPQKSALELLVDQYFDIEQKVLGNERLKRMFEELQSRNPNVSIIHDDEDSKLGYRPEYLKVPEIPTLASWSPNNLAAWTGFAPERMDATIGVPVVLQVKPSQSPAEFAKSIMYGVRQFLNAKKQARLFSFDWHLRGTTLQPPLTLEELSGYLRAVWNGMRSLPYSDDAIMTAFGVTANLYLEGLSNEGGLEDAGKVLDNCFEVEFATELGSSSRGYMTPNSLLQALRPDLDEFISDEMKDMMQRDPHKVLIGIFSPNRLLDFKALCRIFAHELIPSQVLTRGMVLYSPAVLSTFGLP
jgi:FRG domain-containing protein